MRLFEKGAQLRNDTLSVATVKATQDKLLRLPLLSPSSIPVTKHRSSGCDNSSRYRLTMETSIKPCQREPQVPS